MNPRSPIAASVVENDTGLTLVELSRACRVRETQIEVWVHEGLLQPAGSQPQEWRFVGASLRRARLAQRLSRDLELDTGGVALALDLLDEIEDLKARLRRLGAL
jgi:chaperone modulatory protein CbpM